MKNYYARAAFIKSAAKFSQLPPDVGIEVAFVGRSNVGKSSVLNVLTQQKRLAKTSRTPGRTQLINLFGLDEDRRLVDVPGYGYAQVPHAVKEAWQKSLAYYLEHRQCLYGLVVLVDSRHPMKLLDKWMVDFALSRQLKVHILLTKIDKISKSAATAFYKKLLETYKLYSDEVSIQLFSAHTGHGLDALIGRLNSWFYVE
jgi:GTP-binding protein